MIHRGHRLPSDTSGVAARARAAEVVTRVMTSGAHSNVLLDQPVDLDGRQRAAAQRLALDTLRRLPRIDATLANHSSRPLADVDPEALGVLRVAVAELLTGGDAHGVVDSAVESVRLAGRPTASGYVNAVLRSITSAGLEDPGSDPTGRAMATGTPRWVRDRLVESWGAEEADAFLESALEPAPIGVRLRPGADPATPGVVDGIPRARWVGRRDAVADQMAVMDPASTAVVQALEVPEGSSVLDVAAAPGNKTAAIGDALSGAGRLVAVDRHQRRATTTSRRLDAMGIAAAVMVADGRHPPFRAGTFDRVLLDAPCSGLGTLRRRPEIKLRIDPETPMRMGELQREMLQAGIALLKPGGRLVYSVCTVFSEETIEVVAGLGARPPDDLPGRVWGDGRLLAPHLTGTDGMFVAVIDV